MTPTHALRRRAGTLADVITAALHRLQFLNAGLLHCALWFALACALSLAVPPAGAAPMSSPEAHDAFDGGTHDAG